MTGAQGLTVFRNIILPFLGLKICSIVKTLMLAAEDDMKSPRVSGLATLALRLSGLATKAMLLFNVLQVMSRLEVGVR